VHIRILRVKEYCISGFSIEVCSDRIDIPIGTLYMYVVLYGKLRSCYTCCTL
jgi:hypothetical protein